MADGAVEAGRVVVEDEVVVAAHTASAVDEQGDEIRHVPGRVEAEGQLVVGGHAELGQRHRLARTKRARLHDHGLPLQWDVGTHLVLLRHGAGAT
jgi:hypothetical protein